MSHRVRDVSIKVDSPYCLKALNDNIKKCGMTVIFRRQLWIREWQRKWNETAWILAWQHWLLGTLKADVQVGAWGQLIGKTLYRCFLKCLLLECSVLPNDPCESARLGHSNAGDGRRGTIFSSFGSSAGDLREPLDLLHGYHFSKQIS